MIDVVIADDDEQARATLGRILSRAAGMRVVGEAVDGDQAVAMVRELRPDVAVLDVHMPGTSGVEAAETLRGLHNATPIVFVTADPAAAEPALCLSSTSLVVKSLASARDTIAAVERAVAGVSRRRRRALRAAPPA